LASLIVFLSPKRIVAIGNDAARCARRIAPHTSVIQVRHPSYGGQNQFLSEIRSIYKGSSRMLF
jgi:hypothetical protein